MGSVLRSALVLGAFGLMGSALVAIGFALTQDRIEANDRAALLEKLHEVVPPGMHDNDMFVDVIEVRSPSLLGSERPLPVYRAREGGQPVAVALAVTAPDGYTGPIRLLVGIRYDGTLTAVRVLSHAETPGLGDRIEPERSDWIQAFAGRSLASPEPEGWAVERDGGVFDQLTGATVTSRAVVDAVYDALRFFRANRERLFERPRTDPEAVRDLVPEPAPEAPREVTDG